MRIYKSISANYVFIEKRLFQVGNALILRWLNKLFFSRIYVKSFFCPADASEMEAEERKQRIDTEKNRDLSDMKVLLLEDNPLNAEIALAFLERSGSRR